MLLYFMRFIVTLQSNEGIGEPIRTVLVTVSAKTGGQLNYFDAIRLRKAV
jgi:hypothetical protein